MNIPEILPCPNPECRYDKMCVCSMNNVVGDATCDCTYWAACLKCGYQGPKALSEGESIEKHNAICRQPTPEAAQAPEKLPCDVFLPPNLVIHQGCKTSILIKTLSARTMPSGMAVDKEMREAFLKWCAETAHPPKPEPTEAMLDITDLMATDVRRASAPKPPAEWMEEALKLAARWEDVAATMMDERIPTDKACAQTADHNAKELRALVTRYSECICDSFKAYGNCGHLESAKHAPKVPEGGK